MGKESRVKKTLLNAKVNTVCYFASLVIAFFTRRIFLDYLGSNFLGLTSTITSLLGFLNLAELGVGTAIGYVLYKPLFDDDQGKIREVVSIFGYLYRIIGLVILGLGVSMSIFLPWIFANTSFSLKVVYVGYYAILFSNLLGYFVNYKITLLSADQRNYVVTGYFQITTSVKIIVQMILAIYLCNFYVYFSIEILFGIINSIILNIKIRQTYPWLKTDIKLGHKLLSDYPEIGKYVRQIFVHKIGGFAQGQIIPLLIYNFSSLAVVALYENYTLISQRVRGAIGGVLDSTSAGIGNLISEGDKKRIYSTFRELFSFRLFIAGVISACLYKLSSPFISLWLGQQYIINSILVFLISLQTFSTLMRGTTDQYLYGFGLFYDVWAPAVEAILSVTVSIVLGSFFGLAGVLSGPLFAAFIIVHIWKPIFLYGKGFKKPFNHYVLLLAKHIVPIIIAYFAVSALTELIVPLVISYEKWTSWIIYSSVFTLLYIGTLFASFFALSKDFRAFVRRFIKKKMKAKL